MDQHLDVVIHDLKQTELKQEKKNNFVSWLHHDLIANVLKSNFHKLSKGLPDAHQVFFFFSQQLIHALSGAGV